MVSEMQKKWDLRTSESVDKNGNPDGTGTGWGWFLDMQLMCQKELSKHDDF